MSLMEFSKIAWWMVLVLGTAGAAFGVFVLLFGHGPLAIPVAIGGIASGLTLAATASSIILALRCAEKYLTK